MNSANQSQFHAFLQLQNYSTGTIAAYLGAIENHFDLPETDDPSILLSYIDSTICQKRGVLTESGFKTLRASLSAFFLMRVGIHIRTYRKLSTPEEQYSEVLRGYKSYCSDFLVLSDAVVAASVREARLFLHFAAPEIKTNAWSAITANTVIGFLETKRANLSPGSLGVTVTAIRRFFRFLQHSDHEVHASVFMLPLSVPNWSKGSKLPITLTDEDRVLLNAHMFPDTPNGLRDRAVLHCFTELGLRCSEVAKLQLSDIRWQQGTILIRKTKTRAERELPMSQMLGQILEEYLIRSRPKELGDSLFYHASCKRTQPASVDCIRGIIRRLFSRAGIVGRHKGTHALRRSVASDLYSAGNSLKTVADLLGHNSLSATKAYVRIDVESLRTIASAWPERGIPGV